MTEVGPALTALADTAVGTPDRAARVRSDARRRVRRRRAAALVGVAAVTIGVASILLGSGEPQKSRLLPAVTPLPADVVISRSSATPNERDIVSCGGRTTMAQLTAAGGVETERSPEGDLFRKLLAERPMEWPGFPATNWIFLGRDGDMYVRFGHRTGAVGIDHVAQLERRNGQLLPTSYYGCSSVLFDGNLTSERLDTYSTNGNLLTVNWSNGDCGAGLERVLDRIDLTEQQDRVYLRVVSKPNPNLPKTPPGTPCFGVGRESSTTTLLREPLGQRPLLDTSQIPAKEVRAK